MLDVVTNHQIVLLFFREGQSIRKIAEKLKISRQTVTARIKDYEQFKATPISNQDHPNSLFHQYLKTGSVYKSGNREKRKLSEDIIAIVNKCLEENEIKRLNGGLKQQLKKIDIYKKIINAGHIISYSTVCKHIGVKDKQVPEVFILQVKLKAPVV